VCVGGVLIKYYADPQSYYHSGYLAGDKSESADRRHWYESGYRHNCGGGRWEELAPGIKSVVIAEQFYQPSPSKNKINASKELSTFACLA
jgi:hypothetical protein